MSSDVQSAVQLQIFNNDMFLAGLTVVIYDYILMFPSEVKHIWNKPWTWVTVLYLIVRYVGIYYAIVQSIFGTTFVPGPVKVISYLYPAIKGIGLVYSDDWAGAAFTCASTLLMVLRVHAMWSRSKVILTILLVPYTVNVILHLAEAAFFYNPHIDAIVGTSQVLDYSVCTEVIPAIGPYVKYMVAFSTFFDVLLLILALIPLVKQSITMYKATGSWEPNRYMSLIVKEGVSYFFVNLLNNITIAILNADGNPLPPLWDLILALFYVITMFPIVPRFFISMRQLFDKDSRGRFEGIDSAFGISSRSGKVAELNTSVSGIAFAGVNSSHTGEEGGEELQLGNDASRSCPA